MNLWDLVAAANGYLQGKLSVEDQKRALQEQALQDALRERQMGLAERSAAQEDAYRRQMLDLQTQNAELQRRVAEYQMGAEGREEKRAEANRMAGLRELAGMRFGENLPYVPTDQPKVADQRMPARIFQAPEPRTPQQELAPLTQGGTPPAYHQAVQEMAATPPPAVSTPQGARVTIPTTEKGPQAARFGPTPKSARGRPVETASRAELQTALGPLGGYGIQWGDRGVNEAYQEPGAQELANVGMTKAQTRAVEADTTTKEMLREPTVAQARAQAEIAGVKAAVESATELTQIATAEQELLRLHWSVIQAQRMAWLTQDQIKALETQIQEAKSTMDLRRQELQARIGQTRAETAAIPARTAQGWAGINVAERNAAVGERNAAVGEGELASTDWARRAGIAVEQSRERRLGVGAMPTYKEQTDAYHRENAIVLALEKAMVGAPGAPGYPTAERVRLQGERISAMFNSGVLSEADARDLLTRLNTMWNSLANPKGKTKH